MKPYCAPLRDLRFVIDEALDAPAAWAALPALAHIDAATAAQVLEAASRFASDVLSPLNASGDREGCTRDAAGNVRTPAGFRAAYGLFVAGGWPSLAVDADIGGQGLPLLLDVAIQEMLAGANHGWTMYPGLLHGAVETLRAHGSAELRERYLPRLVSGEWLAAMALSEPDAGSDLGRVRTRASERPDGSLRIDGTKIFISGGDHDLTDNIVHLVLCRRDGAPPGSKGLTLALVPKWLPDGSRNGVACDGIETKLGIHGSATCTIRYDNASGWLVGEFERGLAAMFVMMNSARLRVGVQGVAHADAAGQRALDHALERRQSRAPGKKGSGDADPISEQPAVRRKLYGLQAFVEGARLVACFTALRLDVATHHPDERERARATAEVGLLTPAIKAFFTQEGFRRVSDALQVLGGYGYLADYGIEQTLRDARIAMIYEGTNEIQAVDLLVRKVLGSTDGRRGLESLLARFESEAEACRIAPELAEFAVALSAQCASARAATASLGDDESGEPDRRWHVADDYLVAFGHLLLTWSWATAARAARGLDDLAFANRKMSVCRFGIDWIQDEGMLCWQRVQRCRPIPPAPIVVS